MSSILSRSKAGDAIAGKYGLQFYLTREELKAVKKDDRLLLLCRDRKHYMVRVEDIDEAKEDIHLHFHRWNAKFDYHGPLYDIYLARMNTHLTEGLNTSLNRYAAEEAPPKKKKAASAKESEVIGSENEMESTSKPRRSILSRTRYKDDEIAKPRLSLKSRSRDSKEEQEQETEKATPIESTQTNLTRSEAKRVKTKRPPKKTQPARPPQRAITTAASPSPPKSAAAAPIKFQHRLLTFSFNNNKPPINTLSSSSEEKPAVEIEKTASVRDQAHAPPSSPSSLASEDSIFSLLPNPTQKDSMDSFKEVEIKLAFSNGEKTIRINLVSDIEPARRNDISAAAREYREGRLTLGEFSRLLGVCVRKENSTLIRQIDWIIKATDVPLTKCAPDGDAPSSSSSSAVPIPTNISQETLSSAELINQIRKVLSSKRKLFARFEANVRLADEKFSPAGFELLSAIHKLCTMKHEIDSMIFHSIFELKNALTNKPQQRSRAKRPSREAVAMNTDNDSSKRPRKN